jgi:hypothetical protein
MKNIQEKYLAKMQNRTSTPEETQKKDKNMMNT